MNFSISHAMKALFPRSLCFYLTSANTSSAASYANLSSSDIFYFFASPKAFLYSRSSSFASMNHVSAQVAKSSLVEIAEMTYL